MRCPRCKGLMPLTIEFDESTRRDLNCYICINCGERVDPIILENRRAQQKVDPIEPH